MTLGIGTLPTRTRQPVRVISAVYPVQSREQRRLLARNASHAGRLVPSASPFSLPPLPCSPPAAGPATPRLRPQMVCPC